jgi:hypothetical protein
MSDSIIYVLKKMCLYVNVVFEEINFEEDNWYWKYEWTKEEEQDFIEWLANEIKSNNEIRKGLTRLPYRPSKARCSAFANHFNMMFGWKTKTKEL